MKTLFFSCQPYEQPYLEQANLESKIRPVFTPTVLTHETAIMASGYEVISAFVSDTLNEAVLGELKQHGTRCIALRSAGFNHVNIAAAKKLGITVFHVPAYSPHAVAEFAVALVLTLNRKILRASQHIREYNFSLKGLMGFDLNKKTVGVIGVGKIGAIFARIMHGFGCNVIGFDVDKKPECESFLRYVSLDEIYQKSHIISLHCPLNKNTKHIINQNSISHMRDNVMLINTGRGALIDSKDVINALKSKKIGYLGLDVYEEEKNLFFADHSEEILTDDVFARLLTFPNVIITGHQAYFTSEAMQNIAKTTIDNIECYAGNKESPNNITTDI